MSKFLDTLFFIIFSLYNKWGNFNSFSHSAIIVGVLFASTLNFIWAILFLITENDFFEYGLFPIGVILIFIILCFIYYYHHRKNILIMFYSENKNHLNRGYVGYYILLVLMSLTWFVTPFVLKLGG